MFCIYLFARPFQLFRQRHVAHRGCRARKRHIANIFSKYNIRRKLSNTPACFQSHSTRSKHASKQCRACEPRTLQSTRNLYMLLVNPLQLRWWLVTLSRKREGLCGDRNIFCNYSSPTLLARACRVSKRTRMARRTCSVWQLLEARPRERAGIGAKIMARLRASGMGQGLPAHRAKG